MKDDLIRRQAATDALWEEREKMNAFMDECLKNGNMALRAGTKAERNRIEEDIYILKQLPSAQPERKTGKWITNDYESAREFWDRVTTCSLCGYEMGGGTPNFCPNCGADMRGEQDG